VSGEGEPLARSNSALTLVVAAVSRNQCRPSGSSPVSSGSPSPSWDRGRLARGLQRPLPSGVS